MKMMNAVRNSYKPEPAGNRMVKPKKEEKDPKKKEETAEKKYKLGTGKRFEAVEKSAKASGAKNPAAVAAMAGRMKYGAKKMAMMAAKGRKK